MRSDSFRFVLLAFACSLACGCVSLFDVRDVPQADGKIRKEIGLLGFNLDDQTLFSLVGRSEPENPEAIRLIRLFDTTEEREEKDLLLEVLSSQQLIDLLKENPPTSNADSLAAAKKQLDLYKELLSTLRNMPEQQNGEAN